MYLDQGQEAYSIDLCVRIHDTKELIYPFESMTCEKMKEIAQTYNASECKNKTITIYVFSDYDEACLYQDDISVHYIHDERIEKKRQQFLELINQ